MIKLTQTGTNIPAITTGKNNLLDGSDNPIMFVPSRSATGVYELTFVPDPLKNYLLIVSSGTLSDVGDNITITMKMAETNKIKITSKSLGLDADGQLNHTFILREIKTAFTKGEF